MSEANDPTRRPDGGIEPGAPSDTSGSAQSAEHSCSGPDRLDQAGGAHLPAPPPNAPPAGEGETPVPSRTAAPALAASPRIPADAPIPQVSDSSEQRHQTWAALSSPSVAPSAQEAPLYPFATELPGVNSAEPATSDHDGVKQTPSSGLSQDTGYAFGDTPPPPDKAGATTKNKKNPFTPASGPFDGKSLGPLLTSEALQRGPDGTCTPVPPTVLSRVYAVLSYAPLVLIVLLLAAQVLFTLDARALWYSDEVRHANAFQSMVREGHWFVLHMNGEAYPDKPPMYFWFLALIQMVMGGDAGPRLFFIGTAVSGLLLLLATHAMARLVARVDGRAALAAGLILLTGFFFSGLLHYSRMDLLFAALITASHTLLFHAWVRQRAAGLMALGFALAGAATLVKGPFGLAFPLLAGVGFVLWQGRASRLFRLDTLLGLFVGLALPAAWLGAAWMTAGDAFIDNIFGQQIVARALEAWHHPQPWFYYFMILPLLFLPWTFLLLFLPWTRLFSKETRAAIKASRTPELAGLAYIWATALTGFALLSAISIKLPIYLLPLFPPLAILAGRALLRLSPGRSKAMHYCLALVLFLLAAALVLLPLIPKSLTTLPVVPSGTFILAGICLVGACALAFLPNNRRPEGSLLLLALFSAAFAYPAWSISAPSLDVFMSPKVQAEKLKQLKDDGYQVFSYEVYAGTYSYYAGTVPRIKDWNEVLETVAKLPKAAVAMRASTWEKMQDKPEGFAVVSRQTIAERDYVLVARPTPGGTALSPVQEKTIVPSAAPKAEENPPVSPESKTQRSAPPPAASESSPDTGTLNPDALTPGIGDMPEAPGQGKSLPAPSAPLTPDPAADAVPVPIT